jgi:hypothetical protein|tara:strand:- start:117 stop:266 length:150 start_codon:yes stop_codon:yes gene_type:complete
LKRLAKLHVRIDRREQALVTPFEDGNDRVDFVTLDNEHNVIVLSRPPEN